VGLGALLISDPDDLQTDRFEVRAAGWRATHRNLSTVDLKFRELAKDSPEFLDRAQFRFMDETAKLLDDRLQSWPTFVGAEKFAELKRAALEISRLLRSVPERIFQNDPEKLSDFYGLGSPLIAELLFTPPTGAETMLSRGDLIETASGFKCIEFNFTPSLGGWGTTIITGLQLSAPPTARFIESEGLRATFTETMLEMFRHVIEDARGKGIVRAGEAIMVAPSTTWSGVPSFSENVTEAWSCACSRQRPEDL
jgi:hypothetical protein